MSKGGCHAGKVKEQRHNESVLDIDNIFSTPNTNLVGGVFLISHLGKVRPRVTSPVLQSYYMVRI